MQVDEGPADTRDGRDSRWDAHRERRRQELVEIVLEAIRAHGPGVGMDDIAETAGTSKAVLYRHFGDKQGVYRMVTELVSGRIQAEVARAVQGGAEHHPRDAVWAVVDHYLHLVESDPQVYRFVTAGPGYSIGHDPVRTLADQVGAQLARFLHDAGIDPESSRIWGPALVGLVRAAADDWMARPSRPDRTVLVDSLTRLAWNGLRAAATPE